MICRLVMDYRAYLCLLTSLNQICTDACCIILVYDRDELMMMLYSFHLLILVVKRTTTTAETLGLNCGL